ncbi:MAG: type II toxin-antitoxin system VapC family toxin [Gammaproteobacteria bacterium]
MSVLDASALLAYAFEEPGSEIVAEIIGTACISSVNFAEVLTRITRDGHSPSEFAAKAKRTNLQIKAFLAEDALMTANLAPHTRPFGLSLGDRACLALGLASNETVYTADRIWTQLDIGAKIVSIR